MIGLFGGPYFTVRSAKLKNVNEHKRVSVMKKKRTSPLFH